MKHFINLIERFLLPLASKIGAQRHLIVIRDSFATAMPLVLIGSFAVLLNNIWDAVDGMFSTQIKQYLVHHIPWLFELNGIIWWGTFAVFSLFMIISVSYRLAKSYDEDGLLASLVSLSIFIINLPQLKEINGSVSWGMLSIGDFGITSLFSALIISIASCELYIKIIKMNWTIKMPQSVPMAVSKAFMAIIPGGITLYLFAIISLTISNNPITIGDIKINNLISLINALIQSPFMSLGQNLFTIIIVSLLIPLFWFCGIHGGNIMAPLINSVYLPALLENASAVQQGMKMPNLWTSVSWDVYVNFGGVGATLALIIAIYMFSKREDYKAVAKIGLAPGVFMINEPVMFGLPLVLNPLLFLPFILTPVILTLIAYFATFIGIVPPTSVAVPWTTPPVIGAFLATSGNLSATILALFNFILSIVIYIPFIYLTNKNNGK